jgi:hypothetical protein
MLMKIDFLFIFFLETNVQVISSPRFHFKDIEKIYKDNACGG